MGRKACKTCPWRISVPPKGFPGGCISPELEEMAAGKQLTKVMQCHCTPDDDPKVCVGFALRVRDECIGFRLARLLGLIDEVEDDGDLLGTVEQVLEKHNLAGDENE